jgi:hypothetical protein
MANNNKTIAASISDVKFTINHAKEMILPRKEIIKYSNFYINDISEKIKIAVSQGANIMIKRLPRILDLPNLDENKREIVTRAVYKNVVDKFKDKDSGAGYTVKYYPIDKSWIQFEFSGWMPDEIFTDSKKFIEYVNK